MSKLEQFERRVISRKQALQAIGAVGGVLAVRSAISLVERWANVQPLSATASSTPIPGEILPLQPPQLISPDQFPHQPAGQYVQVELPPDFSVTTPHQMQLINNLTQRVSDIFMLEIDHIPCIIRKNDGMNAATLQQQMKKAGFLKGYVIPPDTFSLETTHTTTPLRMMLLNIETALPHIQTV